jgi:hypothetical protein
VLIKIKKMEKSRLKELQAEIARLKEIDNKITERVSAEFEDDCQRPNEDCKHESLMDCDCDTDDGGMPFEAAHTNHDTIGSFDENGDAMEFTSAWTQEDCNEFIEVGCSLQQDMEWANESENIQ